MSLLQFQRPPAQLEVYRGILLELGAALQAAVMGLGGDVGACNELLATIDDDLVAGGCAPVFAVPDTGPPSGAS